MRIEPGQQLLHYRIIDKIGEGGMGAVYRAMDTKLDRVVALKVLPHETAADPNRLERFRREAKAVAALTHPHIVTLHSVEETPSTGSGQAGTHFLTMELVEGDTLDRILPAGGLPLAKLFDVGISMADALAAAHDRGIVHRDLKPANVMLTNDGRIKVLDFGLAKLGDERSPGAPPTGAVDANAATKTRAAPLTDPGTVMGTVAYMSPEQLQGRAVDHRADLFSLGLVLYELATGTRAFAGETSAELISSIMRDTPPPVTDARSDVPRHLARIIGQCLRKEPEERSQSAKDVRNSLRELRREVDSGASAMTSAVSETSVPAAPRRIPWVVLAVAGIAVAAVALFWVLRPDRKPVVGGEPPAVARSVQLRTSVAVLGFKNLSGQEDKAWLSTALSEVLTTELGAGGELRLLPGETIVEMKRELSLSEGETYSRETLAAVRGRLGSDFVVSGSYLSLGEGGNEQLRLDLRLQDAELGETVNTFSESGAEADLLGLIARAGARLRAELGTAATTAEQRASLRAILPTDPEAARAYTEGLDLLRQLDTLAARDRLQEAAAIDPDHAMIRWALAQSWEGLGDRGKTIDEAERAFQRSGDLPDRQRLEVEGLYRRAQSDWPKAIEVYATAWAAAPDDLELGLRLATAHSYGGRGEDALRTLTALRELPGGLGEDPRIGIGESNALFGMGRYEESTDVAAAAVQEARDRGARFVEARAQMAQQLALAWQGRWLEQAPLLEAALETYREAGHRSYEAFALHHMGIVHKKLGEPERAAELMQEALDISVAIGNRGGEAWLYWDMALHLTADLDRKKALFERSLRLMREIRAPTRDLVLATNTLAETTYGLGNLEEARSLHRESLKLARQASVRDFEVRALLFFAFDKQVQGDLAAAHAAAEEILETSKAYDSDFGIGGAHWVLAPVSGRELG